MLRLHALCVIGENGSDLVRIQVIVVLFFIPIHPSHVFII